MNKKFLLSLFIFSISLFVSANTLFVKDGCSDHVFSYYIERINELNYEVVNTEFLKVDYELLSKYKNVFWLCGESQQTIDQTEKEVIKKFLKKGNTSIFIEGENIMYDSAFIDYKFFYKDIFNIKYSKNHKGKISLSTQWSNPVTWGVQKTLILDNNKGMDIMEYTGSTINSVIIQVTKPINRKKLECTAIGVDNYKNRAVLFSFSPALRNVWELDTSNLVNNIYDWMKLDSKKLIELISENNRKYLKESYYELLLNRISSAIMYGSFDELKKIEELYQENKFQESYYQYLKPALKERFSQKDVYNKIKKILK